LLVAGSIASGILYPLAFPPAYLTPIAWVAIVPVMVAARRTGVGGAIALALLWSIICAFQLLDALPPGVTEYFGRSSLIGWSFCALVFALAGLLHAVAIGIYVALAGRFQLTLPLLAGAAMASAEFGRSLLQDVIGPPSCQVAYTQVRWTALIQIASVTGLYGITLLVVAANAALAELWLAWRDGARVGRPIAGLALVGVLVLGAAIFGYAELSRADRALEATRPSPVGVIQGNLDPLVRWQRKHAGENLTEYLELTRQASRAADYELLVWPEAALTFYVAEDEGAREMIANVLQSVDAELVSGGPRARPGHPPAYYNSVFLLSRPGEVVGYYDKQFLLPFAEYNPIPGFDLARRRFGQYRFWAAGEPTAPLATEAGRAGILVCNEALLPRVAAERIREGAEYLIVPTGDAWLGGGWTPWPKWGHLMLAAAVIRAIEQRRYLVRASNSGPSAIIDPWGRVRARTDAGVAAILIGEIRPRSDLTIYARVGDLFAIACSLATLAALLLRAGLFTKSLR
jgi:apolipoprotein N-acyltransferase